MRAWNPFKVLGSARERSVFYKDSFQQFQVVVVVVWAAVRWWKRPQSSKAGIMASQERERDTTTACKGECFTWCECIAQKGYNTRAGLMLLLPRASRISARGFCGKRSELQQQLYNHIALVVLVRKVVSASASRCATGKKKKKKNKV